MSTRVTDFLHELIHSLTKTEKRYFKLFSSRHTIGEENNYIVLFDYIDKQNEYDEDVLFKHFKGEAFLNRFSITKKRLYNHILTALHNFHMESNIQAKLIRMIHGADILTHKTLYAQASKILHSAEKLAEKHELHNILIDIRKKTKILSERDNYLNISHEDIDEIRKKDEELHLLSMNEDLLWNIKSRLLHQMTLQGQVRSKENENIFRPIYAEYQKIVVPENQSLEAKYLSTQIESAYHFAMQDYNQSYSALKTNLLLFEGNDQLKVLHPERYFSLLTNLVYTANHLGYFKESDLFLGNLYDFKKYVDDLPDSDLKIKLFTTLSSIELSFSTQRGDFTKALSFVPRVEDELRIYTPKISSTRTAFLNFKIASIYLSNGENSKALKATRRILNDTSLDKKEDIVSFAYLLELFIHIELEDYDYLPYACKTTIRFLKKRNRLYPFEEALTDFIKRLLQTKNKFDAMEQWENLLVKLKKLSEQPYQASALEYFDFISWAESKASEESYLKICQTKFFNQLKKAG